MNVTISDTNITIDGASDLGIPDIGPDDRAKIEFLQAFAFVMTRLNEELGMLAAQPDARLAIKAAAKGKT